MAGVIAETMKRLAAEHQRYGLASELARAAGVTPTSAGEWLRGETEPRMRYWPAIERFFGLEEGALGSALMEMTAERGRHFALELIDIDRASQRSSEMAQVLSRLDQLEALVADLAEAVREQARWIAGQDDDEQPRPGETGAAP